MMGTHEAARAIAARAIGADVRFCSVSSDTRTLAPGALFVALRGERFNGHEFMGTARDLGAVAALIDEKAVAEDTGAMQATGALPCLVVKDTRRGLGQLAGAWRARFSLPLILVAGSNGKTTVKGMIEAILAAEFGAGCSLATEGNLNNDVGLPLTLLKLRDTHRAAVVELGINHPGETAQLAAIAQPTIVLVNNAQREHQEFMNSVEDVAVEHAAAFAALPPCGVAVINADDEHADFWRGRCAMLARKNGTSPCGRNASPIPDAGERGVEIRDFGIDNPARFSAGYESAGFASNIHLHAPEGDITFRLDLGGVHNVRNAVAAAAAATAAGASLRSVAYGLGQFRAVKGRLQLKRGRHGATVIDDSYNANPDSVRAAIDVLARMKGRRTLILGDMGEVGTQGEMFHREVGRLAADAGIEGLMALGSFAAYAFAAFAEARQGGGVWYAAMDELLKDLAENPIKQGAILVKGSRFMRMERVVGALVELA
ncbi:MAG: UDP-N-acetylmuramoyl-tripeptide--D-alanyl-D-alanine ligase [Betaproteobacteria bacterium]|nr:UDP-N-acetylmuramoyl-tripeptide--D-alanyl-D-alanine ligase [Betaproteobacteria bacterium]